MPILTLFLRLLRVHNMRPRSRGLDIVPTILLCAGLAGVLEYVS